MIKTMKKMTKALGGNILVVTGLGSLQEKGGDKLSSIGG